MPYDIDILMELCDGDRAVVRRIVDLFLADCAAQVETLRSALQRGNVDRLFSVAHSIKGVAGTFGDGDIRNAAVAVEACCRAGRIDEAAPRVAELERALLALAADLRNSPP